MTVPDAVKSAVEKARSASASVSGVAAPRVVAGAAVSRVAASAPWVAAPRASARCAPALRPVPAPAPVSGTSTWTVAVEPTASAICEATVRFQMSS